MSYGQLLKEKRLKFTSWRQQAFQALVRGSLLPKKTKIDKNGHFFLILDLGPLSNQKFGLFSMGKSLYKKIISVVWQLGAFGLKIGAFP